MSCDGWLLAFGFWLSKCCGWTFEASDDKMAARPNSLRHWMTCLDVVFHSLGNTFNKGR
jgi:hypothetical protein